MTFFQNQPTVNELYAWYQTTNTCLFEKRDRVATALTVSGSMLNDPDFIGMTLSEIRQKFARLESELELAYILKIVASAEARFKQDFIERAKKGKRGRVATLADIFKKLLSEKAGFVKLEEDIVEAWRHHHSTANPQVLSQFKGLLKQRHWIAHGRYWPYQGQRYSIDDSFIIVRDTLAECKL